MIIDIEFLFKIFIGARFIYEFIHLLIHYINNREDEYWYEKFFDNYGINKKFVKELMIKSDSVNMSLSALYDKLSGFNMNKLAEYQLTPSEVLYLAEQHTLRSFNLNEAIGKSSIKSKIQNVQDSDSCKNSLDWIKIMFKLTKIEVKSNINNTGSRFPKLDDMYCQITETECAKDSESKMEMLSEFVIMHNTTPIEKSFCEIPIKYLSHIVSISVTNQKLTINPENFYSDTLEELSIIKSNLYVVPLLKGLTNLRRLNLSGNGITEINPQILSIGKIEELNLSNNRIIKVDLPHTGGKYLKTLNLSNNFINNIYDYSYFPVLETLMLSGNKLVDALLPSYLPKTLRNLRLDGAKLNLEDLTKMQEETSNELLNDYSQPQN